MPATDPTLRFSSRVDNYARFRPGYPPEVTELLTQECGLNAGSVVADIGSGTGLFTRLLLQTGAEVFGVEPNPEMREAGEQYLSGFPRFRSVAGTAEETTLEEHSVDIITAAQAAHWFDNQRTRAEFVRILKPGGYLVLLWNEPRRHSSSFLGAYEELLLKYCNDYERIRNERTSFGIEAFFEMSKVRKKTFEIIQQFDYPGLEGRLLSSSYAPEAGEPVYDFMLRDLRILFDQHQVNGSILFEYDTTIFYGRIRE